MSRPETGPMRFGDDWAGVFIRGDDAHHFAVHPHALVDNCEESISRDVLVGLISTLLSCKEPVPENDLQCAKLETDGH